MWIKASTGHFSDESKLRLVGREAIAYSGEVRRISCTLSETGACEKSFYITVESALRPTTGMWNGAKELRMTWLWGAVLTFVPVRVEGHELSDVWRSQTVWKDSGGERHLYLTCWRRFRACGLRRVLAIRLRAIRTQLLCVLE